MKKYFNVTGFCKPDIHYMVNIETRLKEIRILIDKGEYFVINRARQYGKTTTLKALADYLRDDYIAVSLSFQRMSSENFRSEWAFSEAFANAFLREVRNKRKSITGFQEKELQALETIGNDEKCSLTKLFEILSDLCDTAEKPVVLMIDEVDSASNNQVFLDFLAQLRDYFMNRYDTPTFQSVILAGVYNSPWNIAADFEVDMSFSIQDIFHMLSEYEKDNGTGMDIGLVSELIFDYTSGYPYLVSRLCKLIDEQVSRQVDISASDSVWSEYGVSEAVKILLRESNTLFDDMRKKITDYPELRRMLYSILFTGQSYSYNPYNFAIDIGTMFGFLKESNGQVAISNRIFETRLYNLFLSEEMTDNITYKSGERDKNQFVKNGMLDMDLVMTKFMLHFHEVYRNYDEKFIEENGRRYFLLYLKPIINGVGNYYIEARTRDMCRTDVIIDYRGKQFIVEIKIWHGDEYNRRGEKQLAGYLETYHLQRGYLLSFNFNKSKQIGTHEIQCGEKSIFEVVV